MMRTTRTATLRTRRIRQHDLFGNPTRASRAIYPLLAVMQSDYVESESRLVAPLRLRALEPMVPASKAVPSVTLGERYYVLVLPQVASIDARRLLDHVGSVAAFRDDITRALDWLFCGIWPACAPLACTSAAPAL